MKNSISWCVLFVAIASTFSTYTIKLAIRAQVISRNPVNIGASGTVEPHTTALIRLPETMTLPTILQKSVSPRLTISQRGKNTFESLSLTIQLTRAAGTIEIDCSLMQGALTMFLETEKLEDLGENDTLICHLMFFEDLLYGTRICGVEREITPTMKSGRSTHSDDDLVTRWRKYITETAQDNGIQVSTCTSQSGYTYSEGNIALQMRQKYLHIAKPPKGRSLFKGTRKTLYGAPIRLTDCLTVLGSKKTIQQKAWHYLQDLAQEYQIECMPYDIYSMMNFITTFFKALKNNPELQKALHSVAILPVLDDAMTKNEVLYSITDQQGRILPLVVIYPASGKHNAQLVLNTLYKLAGQADGLGVAPHFSCRISDFLFYSQGNKEDKILPRFKSCFAQPDQVLYRKDFQTYKEETSGLQEPYFGDDTTQGAVVEVRNKEDKIVQQAHTIVEHNYHLSNPANSKKKTLIENDSSHSFF